MKPRKLRDAHAHLPQHGRAAEMVRLGGCASKEACLSLLAAACDASAGGWILGAGLRVESWPQPTYPTARELDSAVRGRACCAWSFDYHALAASSVALKSARITPHSADPPGGVVCRDERSGEPTGLLLEAAAHLVWNTVP